MGLQKTRTMGKNWCTLTSGEPGGHFTVEKNKGPYYESRRGITGVVKFGGDLKKETKTI